MAFYCRTAFNAFLCFPLRDLTKSVQFDHNVPSSTLIAPKDVIGKHSEMNFTANLSLFPGLETVDTTKDKLQWHRRLKQTRSPTSPH